MQGMVEERGHSGTVLFGRGDMILPGALKKRRCRKVVSQERVYS